MTDEQILQTARDVGWNVEHKASNDYLVRFARALMVYDHCQICGTLIKKEENNGS